MADSDMTLTMSISFVRTFIPKDEYKDKEEANGLLFYHFDPVYKENMGGYDCVECSVLAHTCDAAVIESAYEDWKKKQAASELAYNIRRKIDEIEAYDKSSEVNGFYLNGQLVSWDSDDDSTLNKNKRMGLRQNIKDKISLGEENIDMWLGGMKITLSCEQADALMRNLENYAYGCFNVTAAHKKAVSELTSIDEVEKFDITSDYPEQLKMEV